MFIDTVVRPLMTLVTQAVEVLPQTIPQWVRRTQSDLGASQHSRAPRVTLSTVSSPFAFDFIQ